MRESGDRILAVDLGTTAVKTTLIDTEGSIVAVATHEYDLSTLGPSFVEADPEDYWRAFSRGVQEVLRRSNTASTSIRAIGISAQGETLICADEHGQPLRPAIVWLDGRAEAEAEMLRSEFSDDLGYRMTGQTSFTPTWPASKILWLRGHEPSTFRKTRWFLLVEDYFIARLTGRFVCEGSLATSTMYWELSTGEWWPDMLRYLQIDETRLPRLVDPGSAVGPILQDVARDLGLDSDTIVCTGALDQAAGAIGVGNVTPGIFSANTGAALAICATVPSPFVDPDRLMPCHYHGVPKSYMAHTFTTGGIVMRWFRDEFCGAEMAEASRTGSDPYDLIGKLAATVPAGSEGLVMLPHLQGAMAPESNPHARGVFFGLSLHHRKAHLARAIMEAIAYIVARNIETLEGLGIRVSEVRALGGGARSPVWNQIMADVSGRPVVTMLNPEAACLGAAILAGTAVGVFPSLREAVDRAVHIKERYLPTPDLLGVYERGFADYRALYDDLVPAFDRMRMP